MKKKTIAIMYDFDGTLSPKNMQEYSLFPSIRKTPKEFWAETKEFANNNKMDEISAYLYKCIEIANQSDVRTCEKDFSSMGSAITFFPGVETWFDKINDLSKKLGLHTMHFVISSGIGELIDGCKIASKLDGIFACRVIYDKFGRPIWPAGLVNYTTKTQFLFRINKGIFKVGQDEEVNKYVLEEARPVPWDRMIYIGDGLTDVPCMKLVRDKGGLSLAVYNKSKKNSKKLAQQLFDENRCSGFFPADYSNNSLLSNCVENYLRLLASKIDFETSLNANHPTSRSTK